MTLRVARRYESQVDGKIHWIPVQPYTEVQNWKDNLVERLGFWLLQWGMRIYYLGVFGGATLPDHRVCRVSYDFDGKMIVDIGIGHEDVDVTNREGT